MITYVIIPLFSFNQHVRLVISSIKKLLLVSEDGVLIYLSIYAYLLVFFIGILVSINPNFCISL